MHKYLMLFALIDTLMAPQIYQTKHAAPDTTKHKELHSSLFFGPSVTLIINL